MCNKLENAQKTAKRRLTELERCWKLRRLQQTLLKEDADTRIGDISKCVIESLMTHISKSNWQA